MIFIQFFQAGALIQNRDLTHIISENHMRLKSELYAKDLPFQKRSLSLPKTLQDVISEYNVEHRMFYKKVMKELKYVFTCHLCNKISIEGLRYRSEHDKSIMYCSTRCRNIRGWIGSCPYSN